MSAACHAKRVLVIEDNRDFAFLMCSALNQLGCEVDAVNNGADGIAKAREMKPDIIFCDIGLPGANGFEVAQTIRKDASIKDTFMIALTGYAGLREIDLARESGFNIHMSKPVSIVSLKNILDQAPELKSASF